METKRNRSLAILGSTVGAVALAAVLYYVVDTFFERYETTINEGWSPEAWRNPSLGAIRFLERLGVEVRSDVGLQDLLSTADGKRPPDYPATGDTLVASYTYVFESPSLYQPLIDWVREGGHLVLDLSNYHDEEDIDRDNSFVEFLQVRMVSGDSFFDAAEQLTDAQVWEQSDPLLINFSPYNYLETEREELDLDFWDDYGSHLMEFTEGNGMVTVLSDTGIWENGGIGEHDHATLLAHLLAGRNGKVFFIINADMPSLWSYIWARVPEAATALLILAILMIWRLYNRFGPIITNTDTVRRSLREHLLASGRFLWQHQLGGAQLQQVRSELVHYLEHRHPQWRSRDPEQQTLWLSERTGLAPAQVHSALHDSPRKITNYTDTIRTLQTLRNRL